MYDGSFVYVWLVWVIMEGKVGLLSRHGSNTFEFVLCLVRSLL